MNARIHKTLDEEADSRCLGPYVFGKTSTHVDAQSNRSLLLELCHAHDLAVANTFMGKRVDELTVAHFGKIGFVSVQRAWLGTVRQLYSDMSMALAITSFPRDCGLTDCRSQSRQKDDPEACIQLSDFTRHLVPTTAHC